MDAVENTPATAEISTTAPSLTACRAGFAADGRLQESEARRGEAFEAPADSPETRAA